MASDPEALIAAARGADGRRSAAEPAVGNHPGEDAERAHTDESLRVEREKVDAALGETPTAIDATADAVISRARARADAVLAQARARTDRHSASPGPGPIISRARAREDQVLRAERVNADESLREERAEHLVPLAREREGTDEDLFIERAAADQALAARDEFLGLVSHDLQNLLAVVVGFASLIEQGVARADHADQVRRYAQRIQRSGDRMIRLVGDLVDVASIEAGRLAVTLEVGDPTPIVTEAVDTFQARAAAAGIALAAEIGPRVTRAVFDPARILQVLTNLISNTIKFTPPGGKVGVRVERRGDEIRFAVSDTGPGIPPEMLTAIFERYLQVTRGDRPGLGIGLYLSQCIMQGHGGRIWAESRMGEGSTLFFTLPVPAAPPRAGRPDADNSQADAETANGRAVPVRV